MSVDHVSDAEYADGQARQEARTPDDETGMRGPSVTVGTVDEHELIPEPEWCSTCREGTTILETSVETTGAMERERDWHVVRLACGHETSSPVA